MLTAIPRCIKMKGPVYPAYQSLTGLLERKKRALTVKKCATTLSVLLFAIILPALSFSLSLEEAVSLARETLPAYKASLIRVKSTEALYTATLGPYLPGLDASASPKRFYTSMGEFSSRSYDLTLSYTLFDGGKRRADRSTAYFNLGSDKEELRKNLIDLEYNVKNAFYAAIARKESLAQRETQLRDAQKDYEVAEGRYKFGVARLSDVLQASVRLEQARYNLVQAEGELRKAFSDLNSLIGNSLDSRYELQGTLDMSGTMPDRGSLSEAALRRPEVRQAEYSLEIAGNARSSALGTLYPVISATASYTKTGGGTPAGIGFPGGAAAASGFGFGPVLTEEKAIGITATWNLFELGKYFRIRSAGLEQDVSVERLKDVRRQALLNVHKLYEDFLIASDQLTVARQQVKQAEHNYAQAFGEYKVGKADILSLVQAESLLSTAREQLIQSRLNLVLSRTALERAAGIQLP